jgi:putative addiction module antidote
VDCSSAAIKPEGSGRDIDAMFGLGYNVRMNMTVKITKIGNSAGIILPKHVLSRLRIGLGDNLYVSETTDGGVRLTVSNPDFEAKMNAAEKIMREDRDILRVLAQ